MMYVALFCSNCVSHFKLWYEPYFRKFASLFSLRLPHLKSNWQHPKHRRSQSLSWILEYGPKRPHFTTANVNMKSFLRLSCQFSAERHQPPPTAVNQDRTDSVSLIPRQAHRHDLKPPQQKVVPPVSGSLACSGSAESMSQKAVS